MIHIMLDLETLGLSANAAIIQVGAVKFDPAIQVAVDVVGTFERTISIASNLEVGRTIDGPTLEWWFRQSDEARRAVTTNTEGLKMALLDFNTWTGYKTEFVMWSHGAAFDIPLLNDAMTTLGLAPPWNHRAPRDTRTLFWLAESLAGWEKPQRVTAHTALADAVAQAEDVQSAYAALAGRSVLGEV